MKRFLKRKKSAIVARPTDGHSLFITGGIGDVIALSCFLKLPAKLEHIFYATQARRHVQDYLATLCGPDVEHHPVYDDWSRRHGWYSLQEFLTAYPGYSKTLAATDDWSIMAVFPRDLPFLGLPWKRGPSSSTIHELRQSGTLPDRYVAFQPFSIDKRDRHRDFTPAEIAATIAWAKSVERQLILLNEGDDPRIRDPQVIDLQNKTNLFGSIDVTLGATAYIGIDSSMSQVATKVMPSKRLVIKSTNKRPGQGHYYNNLRWYCAPHTSFSFVGTDPVALLKRLDWSKDT